MPRCCEPIRDEFKPSYSSVLVHGPDPATLMNAVKDLEENHPITSCFTAWCSRCSSNYMLTTDIQAFPAPSAHHTHQLKLLSNLRDTGVYPPVRNPSSQHHAQQLRLLAVLRESGPQFDAGAGQA